MSSQRAQEILYESEAALRLVDNELSRMRGGDEREFDGLGDATYPELVESANVQLLAVIEQVRRTRQAMSGAGARDRGCEGSAQQELGDIEARLLEVSRLFEHTLVLDPAKTDRSDDAIG